MFFYPYQNEMNEKIKTNKEKETLVKKLSVCQLHYNQQIIKKGEGMGGENGVRGYIRVNNFHTKYRFSRARIFFFFVWLLEQFSYCSVFDNDMGDP